MRKWSLFAIFLRNTRCWLSDWLLFHRILGMGLMAVSMQVAPATVIKHLPCTFQHPVC
jgi:hypothetical protein